MSQKFDKKAVVICVLAAAGGLTAAEQSGLETQVVDLLAGQLISSAHAAGDSLSNLVRQYDAKRVAVENNKIVLFYAKGGKTVAPDGTYLFPNGTRIKQVSGQSKDVRNLGGKGIGDKSIWIEHINPDPDPDPFGEWLRDASGDASKLQQTNPNVRDSLRDAQGPSVKKIPGDTFEKSPKEFKFGG